MRNVPQIDLSSKTINKEIAAIIPKTMAQRYQIIPLMKNGKKLTLAMVDPTNFYAIDDVRSISGCEVEVVTATEKEIVRAINKSYSVQELVDKAVNQLRPEESTVMNQIQSAEDAPIIRIVNSLFNQAVRERASDIHIEPQEKMIRVRFRIDGVLKEVDSFTREIHAAIISRIKIMSDMDISEKRLPQDGRIRIKEGEQDIDIRVSTLPTIMGEKVVMRILDKKAGILDVNKLGFTQENLWQYRQMYEHSAGLILITGPTGSGKTTTLYSTLAQINSLGENIITIEDPVEYRIEGINQVQVNAKAGLTFATGLKSLLRQDPNIIMVGEIRDSQTAEIAIRAALTGHLVLSTLHTNNAAGAITRLLDMGVEPFLLASSMRGVVAQRLVRQLCLACKKSYVPKEESAESLFLGSKLELNSVLYQGKGCIHCGQTGYKYRMAIHEVLPVNKEIRDLISRRASADEIEILAKTMGMINMREDGIHKAMKGVTTIEEIMRVAHGEL